MRPLHWAPLGWGEPVIPWWGRPGFVGVATWGGWGGPRVVNNVVVHRTTTVQVTNITVYKNVHVHNAVVAVPGDRFGHGSVRPLRVENERVRELTPVRGALEVRPVAASVMPAGGATVKPPAAISERKVVATRAPRDFSPALREQGLGAGRETAAPTAPQIVPAPTPRREKPPTATTTAVTPGGSPAEKGRRDETPAARRAGPGPARAPDAAPAAPGGGRPGSEDKPRGPAGPDDKKARAAGPPEAKPGNRAPRDAEPAPRAVVQPPPPPAHDPNLTRQVPKAPGAPDGPRARPDARPDARAKGAVEPRGRGEQGPPQGREGSPERGDSKPGR